MTEYTYQAFECLAGSSIGNVSERQVAFDLLSLVKKDTDADWEQQLLDLAEATDDDTQTFFEIQEWCADRLNEESEELMPPFCSVVEHDSEWIVEPSVELAQMDEEVTTITDLCWIEGVETPYALLINDHGNASLYLVKGEKCLWSVV